jgi:hypothetical protein
MELGLCYHRLTRHSSAWTRTGFPRSACMRYGRGGCPLYPGGGGVPATGSGSPAAACRFSTASPYHPVSQPASGCVCDEAYEGSLHPPFRPSPLPVFPRRKGKPWAFPWCFIPGCYQPRTPGQGTDPEHWPGATPPASPDLLSDALTHYKRPRVAVPIHT